MYFKKLLQPYHLQIGWLIVILFAISFVGSSSPILSNAAGITPTVTVDATNTPIVSPTDTPIVPATDTPIVPATDTPIVPPTDTPVALPTDTPTPVGDGGGGNEDDDDDDDNNPTPLPPAPTLVTSPTSTITPTGTVPSSLPNTGQGGSISTSFLVGLGIIMILIAGLIALKPATIKYIDDL